MGFYWSYTLLLEPPVFTHFWKDAWPWSQVAAAFDKKAQAMSWRQGRHTGGGADSVVVHVSCWSIPLCVYLTSWHVTTPDLCPLFLHTANDQRLEEVKVWKQGLQNFVLEYYLCVMHEHSVNTINSWKKPGLDGMQGHPLSGHVLANAIPRPHQLCWDDREMGTAISCTKCSQVAGLIHITCKHTRNMSRNINVTKST